MVNRCTLKFRIQTALLYAAAIGLFPNISFSEESFTAVKP